MGGDKVESHRLNLDTKEELEIIGFKNDTKKFIGTVVLTIFSGGLLLFLLSWKPSIKLRLMYVHCDLRDATRILLKDIYGQEFEEVIVNEEVPDGEDGKTIHKQRSFCNKKIKYLWDDRSCTFFQTRYLKPGQSLGSFHKRSKGLSEITALSHISIYGENFMKIEVLSIWRLLVEQAYNPFYFFQLYTVILWSLESYYYFASCIAALSVISITLMVYETRRQSNALSKTVTSESEVVLLMMDTDSKVTSSRNIVPGDIILLADDSGRLEVDAVLLEGQVLTNEAMLTGESVPVTKVCVNAENETVFNERDHKYHVLFSGTEVLQVRGAPELPALVINTGFSTTRGELVRSILFPKPVDFHFNSDFTHLIGCFLLVGLGLVIWSLYHWIKKGATWEEIIYNSLDLITFVVPPILPATITAINVWSQKRLKKQDIFCLSSNYISLAGSVDLMCFDKTGTLTEGDLALTGILPCESREIGEPQEDLTEIPPERPLVRALASCHSLTTINGKLVGNPLDVKIFGGISWKMVDADTKIINQNYGFVTPVLLQPTNVSTDIAEDYEMAVAKMFPFESTEQRMTVVVRRRESTNFDLYIKGAPEKIASFCKPETVPSMWKSAVDWYTKQGVRVIAVAWKPLSNKLTIEQMEKSRRENLENGSELLGLVLMQNKIKPVTPHILTILHDADILPVMITGDNLQTAMSVACQSGLVRPGVQLVVVKAEIVSSTVKAAQHLKVTFYDADTDSALYDKRKLISVRKENYVLATEGESFEMIHRMDKDLYKRLLHRGRVFARMKPDQKILVVEGLQSLGHQVGMCGDGCNDCGALKVAHMGISLSSAEASVAAPFTSRREDITCVPTLIKEGRATLVSVIASFKYNVCYCFSSLICVLIHYSINTEPSDSQYLIMDLVLITVPSLVLGNTGAFSQLVKQRPTKRIISFLPFASVFSFLTLQSLTYWLTFEYTKSQEWFEPFVYVKGLWPSNPNYENTALSIVSFYTFVVGAFVFAHAHPFRKPIYTNYILSAYLLGATVLCLFMNFYQGAGFLYWINFIYIPRVEFLGMLLLIATINAAVSFSWERWVLYGVISQYVMPWLHRNCGKFQLEKHEQIERELAEINDWPNLSEPPRIQREKELDGNKDDVQETSDEDEEAGEGEALLMRKLTRRHQFKATVEYAKEHPQPNSNGHSYSPLLPSNPSKNELSIEIEQNKESEKSSIQSLTPPDSAGYHTPYNALGGQNLSENDTEIQKPHIFKFNQSVRSQVLKGTDGNFSTFGGANNNRKRIQAARDAFFAQPYEVLPINDMYPTENEENIYSTIEVNMIDKKDGKWDTTTSTTTTHQETQDVNNVTSESENQLHPEIK
ncbi:unnamed protein product, partial [Meganyctiphanes norvegica]